MTAELPARKQIPNTINAPDTAGPQDILVASCPQQDTAGAPLRLTPAAVRLHSCWDGNVYSQFCSRMNLVR
jgi:hypothetical protein